MLGFQGWPDTLASIDVYVVRGNISEPHERLANIEIATLNPRDWGRQRRTTLGPRESDEDVVNGQDLDSVLWYGVYGQT